MHGDILPEVYHDPVRHRNKLPTFLEHLVYFTGPSYGIVIVKSQCPNDKV